MSDRIHIDLPRRAGMSQTRSHLEPIHVDAGVVRTPDEIAARVVRQHSGAGTVIVDVTPEPAWQAFALVLLVVTGLGVIALVARIAGVL